MFSAFEPENVDYETGSPFRYRDRGFRAEIIRDRRS